MDLIISMILKNLNINFIMIYKKKVKLKFISTFYITKNYLIFIIELLRI